MAADVDVCRQLGCEGCAELIRHAGSMEVTFHRAFDRVKDPLKSVQDVIDLGCTRILTSGLRPNVDLGKAMLRTLVESAGDRIAIMPGSGVRSTNIAELARFTGARAFHSSARSMRASSMDYTNPAMYEQLETVTIDPDEVAELRRILDGCRSD